MLSIKLDTVLNEQQFKNKQHEKLVKDYESQFNPESLKGKTREELDTMKRDLQSNYKWTQKAIDNKNKKLEDDRYRSAANMITYWHRKKQNQKKAQEELSKIDNQYKSVTSEFRTRPEESKPSEKVVIATKSKLSKVKDSVKDPKNIGAAVAGGAVVGTALLLRNRQKTISYWKKHGCSDIEDKSVKSKCEKYLKG